MSALERLRIWLRPDKIHKLQLTNLFSEVVVAFMKILSGQLARSYKTKALEDDFKAHYQAKHAIIFPHARTALHFILKSLELEKGDEVLMAPLTIADMINSIHSLGLKPVFVDIELDTICIDVEQLEKCITPRSKVLFVTYLCGLVPNIEKIIEVGRKYNLTIIEDCSQCYNGLYNGRLVGTFGDAAILTLTNFKVCSSLFGGMIVTNNDKLAERLYDFRETALLPPQPSVLLKHATKNLIYTVLFSKWAFSYFTYFIVLILEKLDPRITYRLYSGNINVVLGKSENMLVSEFPPGYVGDYTEAQAYVGLCSLSRAEESTGARIKHGELMRKLLHDINQIQLPAKLEGAVNVYWRFPLCSNDREGLKRYLLDHGIDSSATYLCLCSQEPAFKVYHAPTPQAEKWKQTVLLLEVHEAISEDTIRYMASVIRSYFERRGNDVH